MTARYWWRRLFLLLTEECLQRHLGKGVYVALRIGVDDFRIILQSYFICPPIPLSESKVRSQMIFNVERFVADGRWSTVEVLRSVIRRTIPPPGST